MVKYWTRTALLLHCCVLLLCTTVLLLSTRMELIVMEHVTGLKTKLSMSYPRRVEQSEGRQANLGAVGPFLGQELNRGVHGRSGERRLPKSHTSSLNTVVKVNQPTHRSHRVSERFQRHYNSGI